MTALFIQHSSSWLPHQPQRANRYGIESKSVTDEERDRLRADIINYFLSSRKTAKYERIAGVGPKLRERAAEIAYREYLEEN